MAPEPSSDTTTPGTPEYPTDTQRYLDGEGGRRAEDEVLVGQESVRRGDAYRRSLGFSSQSEFNKAMERDQRRIGDKWRRNRAVPAVPAAPMPGGEIADVPHGRRKPVNRGVRAVLDREPGA